MEATLCCILYFYWEFLRRKNLLFKETQISIVGETQKNSLLWQNEIYDKIINSMLWLEQSFEERVID